MNRLNDNISVLLLAILSASSNLLFNITLSGLLPAYQYGDIIFSFNMVTLIASLLIFGKGSLIYRYIPIYRDRKSPQQETQLQNWYTVDLLKRSIILIVIFVVLKILITQPDKLPLNCLYIIDLLPVAILYSFLDILISHVGAAGYTKTRLLVWYSSTAVMLVFLLYTLKLFESSPPTSKIIYIYYIAYSSVIIFTLLVIKIQKIFPWGFTIKKRGHLEKKLRNKWEDHAKKFFQVNLLFSLSSYIGIFLIETTSHIPRSIVSEAQVGYYCAIMSITGFVTILDSFVYAESLSKISLINNSKKSKKAFNQLNSRASYFNMAYAIITTLIIYLFSKKLLLMFGEEFSSIQAPLMIVSITRVILCATGLSAAILSENGHQIITRKIYIQCFFIYLILGLILCYLLGLLGLSMAYLTTSTYRCIRLRKYVKQLLEIKPLGFF
ncbi:MAG: hypothetical protein CMF55_02240 [Legionellales bacterium]|nr:hypothetical protein [Legionellales bacterium]